MGAPSVLSMISGLRAPSLARWRRFEEPEAGAVPGRVRVTFLGVSTLLVTDGESSILVDGFFSRPSLVRVRLGRVKPNLRRIEECLTRFGIASLDAVVVAHSHFDHALDSAVVAQRCGARLLGSASTREIARGNGFPEERFQLLGVNEPLRVGAFELTALPSVHSPGDLAPGEIDGPFDPHAQATDYLTGDCYTFHLRHSDGNLMVQASANVLPGAVAGYEADVIYLGVGTLGKQPADFRERYWREYVGQVGARRVVPIHWDNFTVSLSRPLVPFPAFFDDFDATMEFLALRCALEDVSLGLPVLGRRTDPFRP